MDGQEQAALIERLTRERDQAQTRLAEYQRLFDMQWERSQEADAMWRAAHPGNELVKPDLGDLLQWLMEQAGDPLALARKRGREAMADPVRLAEIEAHLKHIEAKDDPMGPE